MEVWYSLGIRGGGGGLGEGKRTKEQFLFFILQLKVEGWGRGGLIYLMLGFSSLKGNSLD